MLQPNDEDIKRTCDVFCRFKDVYIDLFSEKSEWNMYYSQVYEFAKRWPLPARKENEQAISKNDVR